MRGSAAVGESSGTAERMHDEDYGAGVSDEEERMERMRQEKLEAAALAEMRDEEATQYDFTLGKTPEELQRMWDGEEDDLFDSGW
jgi:putative sterol carrier protein